MVSELELVPTDDLVAELRARAQHSVIILCCDGIANGKPPIRIQCSLDWEKNIELCEIAYQQFSQRLH